MLLTANNLDELKASTTKRIWNEVIQGMSSVELRLDLPEGLANEAKANGLLTPEAIEGLLRAEIRRRRVDRLFDDADRLAAAGAPLSEAEIAAARQPRHSSDAIK